ncbi:MAG: TetR family transcriptional regulator [Oscillospiraceae bacterium]|nr:TetR family transcriptional regulator [Oscillospiraceae bacterium]
MIRKTAKELLADSFRELAQTKAFDKITIKEITDNCGYSPATFYRQFRDKYDLIAWAYSRDLERITEQIAYNEASWRQTLSDAANYYSDHKEYLANLLLHTTGYDAFVRNMTAINYASLKQAVLKSAGTSELDRKTEMLIRLYVFGTVQLSCEWIVGHDQESPQLLAEVYEQALPEPLRQYLY